MSAGGRKRNREEKQIPIGTKVAALVPFGEERKLTWLACIVRDFEHIDGKGIYRVEDEVPDPGTAPENCNWHVGRGNIVNLSPSNRRFFRSGETVFAQFPLQDGGFTSDFYEAIVLQAPRPNEPPYYALRFKGDDPSTINLQPDYIIKPPADAGQPFYYDSAKMNELRERAKRLKLAAAEQTWLAQQALEESKAHPVKPATGKPIQPFTPVSRPSRASGSTTLSPVATATVPLAHPRLPISEATMRKLREEDDGADLDIGGIDDVPPPVNVELFADPSTSEDTTSVMTEATATTHKSVLGEIPRASTAMPVMDIEVREENQSVAVPLQMSQHTTDDADEFEKLDRAASLYTSHTWFEPEMVTAESRFTEPVMWYENVTGQWRKYTKSRTLSDLDDFVVAPYVVRW